MFPAEAEEYQKVQACRFIRYLHGSWENIRLQRVECSKIKISDCHLVLTRSRRDICHSVVLQGAMSDCSHPCIAVLSWEGGSVAVKVDWLAHRLVEMDLLMRGFGTQLLYGCLP